MPVSPLGQLFPIGIPASATRCVTSRAAGNSARFHNSQLKLVVVVSAEEYKSRRILRVTRERDAQVILRLSFGPKQVVCCDPVSFKINDLDDEIKTLPFDKQDGN